jgi:arylsulfatase A-like enzyme
MSDNGGLSAYARGGEKHTHNYPLKSGKGSIYEGGIRVPMLAYWPNITQAETINSTPLIIEDFFPSILEMAQIDTNDFPQTIDGQSFVPLLQNNTESQTNRPLFWHYPNEWGPEGPGIGSYSAVRQGDWKLIYFHTNKTLELYNLKKDIQENQNLLSSDYEKAKQLATKLTQHLINVNAQMPSDKLTKEIIPYPSILQYFKE